jgi:hypothetical protein
MISTTDLIEYTIAENNDSFLDIEADRKAFTDQEAKELLHQQSGCSSASEFQKLAKPEREACYQALFKSGVSISQISRITGVNRPLIYKAIKE